MFKIKKVLPVFLAILMLIPSVNVLAQEHNMTEKDLKLEELISSIDIDRELDNAINGVIDNEVPKEIIDQIKIEGDFISEESLIGSFSTLPSETPEIETGYTVKKLGEIDGESVYSMTAYARPKEIEDKATKLGVTALVGLVWIDNFGMDNELESVFYGWKPTGDSEVSNRELRIYVDNTNRDGIRYPRSNDFTHFSYYRKGFRFSATTTADVTDGRNKGSITVLAETKLWN
ncbi:hypothetical protein KQI38_21225 [Tissierella carlieri]|jgi:hypothetical protein|uniref:Uncharacterized protein n=1 Tax=Tissierella pigra TaxID=2607614 RepID=A0A6N7XNS9_9FIRM|nr:MULTISPECIES: hypothetical protein [Tissierella]MBU5314549.1 hypothetical protein [Tissierella carlieri]MSU03156.1 hypothetical protein [Tissierella pigra]